MAPARPGRPKGWGCQASVFLWTTVQDRRCSRPASVPVEIEHSWGGVKRWRPRSRRSSGPWRRCGVHPLDVPTLRQEGGPDLSQLVRAGPRPRRARATTRRGGETWRQRLTATPRPTSAGTSSGTAVVAALVADTAIHTTLSCHGGREGLPGRGGQGPVANRRGGLEDPQRLTEGEGRQRRGVGRARRATHGAESAPKGPVRRHAADPQPRRRSPGFVRQPHDSARQPRRERDGLLWCLGRRWYEEGQ